MVWTASARYNHIMLPNKTSKKLVSPLEWYNYKVGTPEKPPYGPNWFVDN